MSFSIQWVSMFYMSKPFESVEHSRRWVATFVQWYNHEHHHSGIKYVTPVQRHQGEDQAILKQRKQVYEKAKKQHPERWSGETRNWEHEAMVKLNPVNELLQNTDIKQAA
jgi:putative transposase